MFFIHSRFIECHTITLNAYSHIYTHTHIYIRITLDSIFFSPTIDSFVHFLPHFIIFLFVSSFSYRTTEYMLSLCECVRSFPIASVSYYMIFFSFNLQTNGWDVPHGHSLQARCKDLGLYKLLGETRVLCSNGLWAPRMPSCVPTTLLTNFSGNLNCTFHSFVSFNRYTFILKYHHLN